MKFGVSFYPDGLKAKLGKACAGCSHTASQVEDGVSRLNLKMVKKALEELARSFSVGRTFDPVLKAFGLFEPLRDQLGVQSAVAGGEWVVALAKGVLVRGAHPSVFSG